MAARVVSRLEAFFTDRVGEDLRSIVTYEEDSFDLKHLRKGVGDRYTDVEIDEAINESGRASLSEPIYDDLFAENHGDLTCMVKCYEHVIKVNFVLTDGVGAAVGLDAVELSKAAGLFGEPWQIIIDEWDGTLRLPLGCRIVTRLAYAPSGLARLNVLSAIL